jgi:hypothetical protein
MAANADQPTRELFGVQLPDGTGAPGSTGDRTSPGGVDLTGQSGLPGVGVAMPLAGMADPGSDTVNQPGQNDPSSIAPGPAAGYVSTGAGQGNGAHYPRRPGQQPNGGQ